jgi:hypothetical protein
MDVEKIKWDGKDWIHLRTGNVEGSYVHGNEYSGSIKLREILE